MDDKQKINELLTLIEELSDTSFAKNVENIENWIVKLNKVYANSFRHNYSDIFYKIQDVFSEDTEVAETLGENLNVLSNAIHSKILENPDDANLKNTQISFRKFSDHIKLEIGRYNFIKNHFKNSTAVQNTSSGLETATQEELNALDDKIQKIDKAVNSIRPIATSAQKELDKLDEKLEKNKISSITTLTIFSAVVLAFSGGITFEAGIFKGMAEASISRLIFTISITGFILFNTIFSLLYLVAKMADKSIETKCKFWTDKGDNYSAYSQICGNGYCKKSCQKSSVLCKLTHKYFYVFAVNFVLIWAMYIAFCMWYFQEKGLTLFYVSQLLPILVLIVLALLRLLTNAIQVHRIKMYFKMDILEKVCGKEGNLVNIITSIGTMISKSLGISSSNLHEKYLNRIKDMEYKEALKELSVFIGEEIIYNDRLAMYIYKREHKIHTRKYKAIKGEFKNYIMEKAKNDD